MFFWFYFNIFKITLTRNKKNSHILMVILNNKIFMKPCIV